MASLQPLAASSATSGVILLPSTSSPAVSSILLVVVMMLHIQTIICTFLVTVYSIYYTRRMYFHEAICTPSLVVLLLASLAISTQSLRAEGQDKQSQTFRCKVKNRRGSMIYLIYLSHFLPNTSHNGHMHRIDISSCISAKKFRIPYTKTCFLDKCMSPEQTGTRAFSCFSIEKTSFLSFSSLYIFLLNKKYT